MGCHFLFQLSYHIYTKRKVEYWAHNMIEFRVSVSGKGIQGRNPDTKSRIIFVDFCTYGWIENFKSPNLSPLPTEATIYLSLKDLPSLV